MSDTIEVGNRGDFGLWAIEAAKPFGIEALARHLRGSGFASRTRLSTEPAPEIR